MFMRAVHPGRVLRDELEEFGMTPTEFARQIAVPANRIARIVAGKRSTTGDTALRLGHWFGADRRSITIDVLGLQTIKVSPLITHRCRVGVGRHSAQFAGFRI